MFDEKMGNCFVKKTTRQYPMRIVIALVSYIIVALSLVSSPLLVTPFRFSFMRLVPHLVLDIATRHRRHRLLHRHQPHLRHHLPDCEHRPRYRRRHHRRHADAQHRHHRRRHHHCGCPPCHRLRSRHRPTGNGFRERSQRPLGHHHRHALTAMATRGRVICQPPFFMLARRTSVR